MNHIDNGQLNNDFRTCLSRLMDTGLTAHPRGTTTREHLNYNISLFDPRNRIINFPDRKTNLKYLLGELIWYFSGSNDPVGILPYSKFWDNLRNSGDMPGYPAGTINSNYGYRIFGHDEHMSVPYTEQVMTPAGFDELGELVVSPSLATVVYGEGQWINTVNILKKDKDSRQAIMNIHRPSDRHAGNKDVACTLTLQWLIRENKLHLIVNMRSNDIVLGFTNDVFQFTMLQECMAVQLRETYPDLELGCYYHNAGSMHVYDRHFDMVNKIIADEQTLELPMAPMDVFNDDILTALVGTEAAWVAAGMQKDFAFSEVPAFNTLTPYWQNLVKFCFTDDHAAMHAVFGVPLHDGE